MLEGVSVAWTPDRPPERALRAHRGWSAEVGFSISTGWGVGQVLSGWWRGGRDLQLIDEFGGDLRLIAFIIDPGPIRRILAQVGEPVEPPPVTTARGPPTEWTELVQAHDDRDVMQDSPDELPVIDIHSL